MRFDSLSKIISSEIRIGFLNGLWEIVQLVTRVLALPGAAFFVDGAKTSHVRISFNLVAEKQMDEACVRFADLVRWPWKTTGEDRGTSDGSLITS
ncbi:uncharacterized protein PgNI_09495 [Pyricularia grisea]|uniref:Aminotransferase class I/classII domain-containing protein n=1 Tax=Pyricularia grisea TaxID=148305 RepID=A0A6P8AR80_PYRGI|nr:uncharacterized protein PgNI_09495 [Pyricularia grisea]TLD04615.1 hypothetical protein PgNI_09495 [Pyricularia grisea]